MKCQDYFLGKNLKIKLKTSKGVFRENKCLPIMNFQFFYWCDLENLVMVTKIYTVLCYVPIIYP